MTFALSVPDAKTREEHRPLWMGFEREWYELRYPDVAELMVQHGYEDSYLFYEEVGCHRGHSPNRYFDEIWYKQAYPEVRRGLLERRWKSGFAHYCDVGYTHLAPHWLFDEAAYRRRYVTLTDHYLAQRGFYNGYDHYLSYGEQHGFVAGPFCDVRLLRAMAHRYGEWFGPEGLLASWLVLPAHIADAAPASWYFDPAWYVQTYPQVQEAIAAGDYGNALHHYLTNPTPEAFNPSPWFDEAYYRETSPDILPSLGGEGLRNGYEHFVRFGAHEGRSPIEGVDLRRYKQLPLVWFDCDGGVFDSPFARFVAEKNGQATAAGIDEPALVEDQTRQLFRDEAALYLPLLARQKLDFRVRGVPDVSVIMVVHDQIDLTLQALASLRGGYKGAIELILVDSGSRDETTGLEDLVEGAIILRHKVNIGYLLGCNEALAHVTAPAVLYLNNDVRLYPEALHHALRRLYRAETTGAVAARLVRTNMQLQEAGSIIWRDGATYGYRRQDDPNTPEASFTRDVDYGSAAFLLVKTGLLRRLGGYDTRYWPAYFEDTDLCVRLQKIGARIVYEPLAMVEHLEFGSSGQSGSHKLIQRHWKVFAQQHLEFLRHQQPQHIRNALLGRERRRPERQRVLLIEDRIPLRGLGSGYVRSNDIVRALVALDYHVTVFPVMREQLPAFLLYRDFPEEVELAFDQDMSTLPAFLEERAGYYDLLWVGRTHNMARLLPVLNEASRFLTHCGSVMDTEVVAAPRALLQQAVTGLLPDGTPAPTRTAEEQEHALDALLAEELQSAHYCRQIIAVTEHDARLIQRAGYVNVMVLGHSMVPAPTPRPYAERRDILFLGAFHNVQSPNYDSMMWFVEEVLPYLNALPDDVCLHIAGYVHPSVDMTALGQHHRVEILGAVDDLATLFDRYRVFVAPTRFAGGLPFKVQEAAARGVPMVVTEILREEVGWDAGDTLLSAPAEDPRAFASEVERLYNDEALWQRLRQSALKAVQKDTDPEHFRQGLQQIVKASLN
ncbi:glycosyltransferase [Bombella saccharophila]|uniref:Glycosyltransferase n=1 Tax=Bombella saccharophila TaxID=2967338 RepID=A0ABT3WAM5_9PROT|nr:glycosyltransferase [Bombella saccharophila]MCX5614834.1 glycosyltransferase [Bombella saccharophila]